MATSQGRESPEARVPPRHSTALGGGRPLPLLSALTASAVFYSGTFRKHAWHRWQGSHTAQHLLKTTCPQDTRSVSPLWHHWKPTRDLPAAVQTSREASVPLAKPTAHFSLQALGEGESQFLRQRHCKQSHRKIPNLPPTAAAHGSRPSR